MSFFPRDYRINWVPDEVTKHLSDGNMTLFEEEMVEVIEQWNNKECVGIANFVGGELKRIRDEHYAKPHACNDHCKTQCLHGGPGPENFCRVCRVYTKRFESWGECQHCVCLAKAQQCETTHKHAPGGTCSAYMDGTKCAC